VVVGRLASLAFLGQERGELLVDSGVGFEVKRLLVVTGRTLVIASRCEHVGVRLMDGCVLGPFVQHLLEVMGCPGVVVRISERARVIEARRWIVELCRIRLSSVGVVRGPTPESVDELLEL